MRAAGASRMAQPAGSRGATRWLSQPADVVARCVETLRPMRADLAQGPGESSRGFDRCGPLARSAWLTQRWSRGASNRLAVLAALVTQWGDLGQVDRLDPRPDQQPPTGVLRVGVNQPDPDPR